jgi:hypothetical protein
MKRGNARFIRQPLQRQVPIDLSIDQGNRPVDAFGIELPGHSACLRVADAPVDPKQPTFLAFEKNACRRFRSNASDHSTYPRPTAHSRGPRHTAGRDRRGHAHTRDHGPLRSARRFRWPNPRRHEGGIEPSPSHRVPPYPAPLTLSGVFLQTGVGENQRQSAWRSGKVQPCDYRAAISSVCPPPEPD